MHYDDIIFPLHFTLAAFNNKVFFTWYRTKFYGIAHQ